MDQRLMTSKSAAECLGVSQATILRWVKQGQLDAVKIRGTIRIYTRSIDAILEGKSEIQ